MNIDYNTTDSGHKKITLVILEDNATLVKGMMAELEKPDISVCAVCNTVDKFLEEIKSHQPDVAIVDLRIWGDFSAGLASIRKAKELSLDTLYMIHTAYDEIENFHQGINIGIKAFISKNIYEKPMDEIVRIVFNGGTYYGNFLQNYLDKVKESATQLNFENDDHDPEKVILTNKEQEIIKLLDKGLSQEQIAEQLIISLNTVKAHTKSIRAKYGVTTTKEAVRLYRLRKNK